ncbi:MAG TPA: hypothetical protein VMV89_07590, partial [Candidatus Paceibacterota bacterium]|nr:hypothetical protein [Candidatus Paceibacterota bacterium]
MAVTPLCFGRRTRFCLPRSKAAARSACRRPPGRWREIHSIIFSAALFFSTSLFAQSPFQFPTANQFLYVRGDELKFFAPTAPDKPWTSGSFGCVRDDGTRVHEGL